VVVCKSVRADMPLLFYPHMVSYSYISGYERPVNVICNFDGFHIP